MKTILQFFEWTLPPDCHLWNKAKTEADSLKAAGFTDIWLPPAYKGAGGAYDTGYGVYDLYDLGEFDQKGSVPTKYGTKDEYLAAIDALHAAKLKVIADIVLNHRLGADFSEEVPAGSDASGNRNQKIDDGIITAWTGFNFPNRAGKYSDFTWNHTHFDGVDWDETTKRGAVFQFNNKNWAENVDIEKGNYDFLMGADVDVNNPEVIAELDRWGAWYLNLTKVDGFRLDAIKHISFTFFTHWLEKLREDSGEELWSVGEYWQQDVRALTNYLDQCGGVMHIFDVPLHYNLQRASRSGSAFDMRCIFNNTLTATRPDRAVTFVDNHDTQPGQAMESWVDGWFKPLAYALLLLRREGTPCVFYGDLYGIPASNIDPVGKLLTKLVKARETYAHGEQTDYFDHQNVVGWTRAGDDAHPGSGLAVLMSNGIGGQKEMCVGVKFAGQTFVDLLGNQTQKITLDQSGRAFFTCDNGSVSVWVPEKSLHPQSAETTKASATPKTTNAEPATPAQE